MTIWIVYTFLTFISLWVLWEGFREVMRRVGVNLEDDLHKMIQTLVDLIKRLFNF
jgi:hypothetical protein